MHRSASKFWPIPCFVTLVPPFFHAIWSIFCIDRYVCIRLGIPLGIRFDDVDVCYPHSEKHGITKPDEERDSRLDLLDFLARHAVRTMKRINRTNRLFI